MYSRKLLAALTTTVCWTSLCVGQVINFTRDDRLLFVFSESLGEAYVDDVLRPDPLFPGTFGPFAGQADSSVSAPGGSGVSNAIMTSNVGLRRLDGQASAFCRVTATGGTGYGAAEARYLVEFEIAESTPFVFEGRLTASYVANTQQGDVDVRADLRRINGSDPIDSIELRAEDGNGDPVPVDFNESGILDPGAYQVFLSVDPRNTELEGETAEGLGSFRFTLDLGDRDGDGLADAWEENGIDADGDGVIDIDLPGLGADPDRKDLFVEIDTMVDRAPAAGFVPAVTAAFAGAPVSNPDGSTGITLHLLLDETDIPRAGWPDAWAGFDPVKAARYGTVADRARPNWAAVRESRRLVYRYCVFADTIFASTISGVSELPGDDFIVSLGGWTTPGGTPRQQQGTFMHEFGHALGLRHGGGDDIHHKPNYYSVMNYLWQNPGGYAGWRLSYSGSLAPTLSEASLDESAGNGASEYGNVKTPIGVNGTPQTAGYRRFVFVPLNATVADWNGDGEIDGVQTGDPTYQVLCDEDPPPAGCFQLPSPNQVLRGYNDWANLHYGLGNAPDFADGVRQSPVPEDMTQELADLYAAITDPDAPCNEADLAEPFGTLDLADINAFVAAFVAMGGAADLAAPQGVFDLADIVAFIERFGSGCP